MPQTATNPTTGETVVLVGNEWKKSEQTATNDKGEIAHLVGGQWIAPEARRLSTRDQKVVTGVTSSLTPERLAADNADDTQLANIDTLQKEIGRTKPGPERDTLIAEHNRIKGIVSRPPATEKPAFEKQAETIVNTTPAELIAGSAPSRFIQGVAGTGKGLLQLGGDFSDALYEKVGIPARPGQWFNKKLSDLEAITKKGRAAYDSEGEDWAHLGGSVADPAGGAAAKGINAVKGVVAKALVGAAEGGALGGAQPSGKDTPEARMNDRVNTAEAGAAIGGVVPVAGAILKGIGKAGREATDLFTPSGAGRIADRYIKSETGPETHAALIDALYKAKNLVPNRVPTAAEAVSHLPEGSAVAAMQKISAQQPGGMSARWGHQFAEEEGARKVAMDRLISGAGMNPEKRKVAIDLAEALTDPITKKETPAKFLKALESDERFVKRSVSITKNLDQVFNKKEMKAIEAVAETLAQKLRVQSPNQKTNLQGGLSIADETRTHFPNLLSRPAMVANWLLKLAATSKSIGAEDRVNKAMASKLMNTVEFTQALRDLPPSKTGQVVDALVAHGIPRAAIISAQENQ